MTEKNKITVEVYLDENNIIHSNTTSQSTSLMNFMGMATMGKNLLDKLIDEACNKNEGLHGDKWK